MVKDLKKTVIKFFEPTWQHLMIYEILNKKWNRIILYMYKYAVRSANLFQHTKEFTNITIFNSL